MNDINQDLEHASSSGLVLPDHNLPDKLYVIPIHNRPFFPAQVQIGRAHV